VLVDATAIVRLKCSFHCLILIYFVTYLSFWGAKVLISFELRKFFGKISHFSFRISHFFCTFAAENDKKQHFLVI